MSLAVLDRPEAKQRAAGIEAFQQGIMADEALHPGGEREPPGTAILEAKLEFEARDRGARTDTGIGFAHAGNMTATSS